MNNTFHLVHGEKNLRDLLEVIIADAGYDVRCFDFGEHYLQFIDASGFKKPVAVLSDVNLPAMSGYELAVKIRKAQPLLKIALITGKADDEHHCFAASQLCYTLDGQFYPEKLLSLLASLTACESALISGNKDKYFQHCDFGIDHNCPFYHAKKDQGDKQ